MRTLNVEKFLSLIDGKFDNKQQALKYPTRFARIIVKHERCATRHWFRGTQSYWNKPNEPYREFMMQIIPVEENFLIKNFTLNGLKYLDGYDTLFEEIDSGRYYGYSVDKRYYSVDAILTEDKYSVLDRGENYGSKWGHFEFDRICQ